MSKFYILFLLSIITGVLAFRSPSHIAPRLIKNAAVKMELDSVAYGAIFLATMVPSLAFVKFVGDQADSSRGSLSENTKEKFKKSMMSQPGADWSLPTSEEEALKKQIAKAYMQDKDVDVAVLEEKLKQRALWRKEMIAEARSKTAALTEDEDGW